MPNAIKLHEAEPLDAAPLTIAAFANRLGISKGTVRKWIGTRKITYYRFGKAIRIPPSEERRMKEQNTVPAVR